MAELILNKLHISSHFECFYLSSIDAVDRVFSQTAFSS